MNFSKSVEAARQKKPMTQEEMAEHRGVTQSSISQQISLESVSRDTWKAYAEMFGLTVVQFIGGGID